ncbi:polysaccharide biosynthesis C-terminal domain-containing protein [Sphingomonas sp. LHG3406-1]|uniref:oligosaccharide flippase family protein n=1 Tax=Sphingomonas sp. LHG3406-1 TaxID=2804617 RepID=UPI00260B66CA|nr:polysaccharide biosynthesis C-terminal domain-containing protein [Sphingomonas sp. LHG3406-1]
MNFFSNVLKNASQSVLSGLIGAVGSFAASVIVARLLGVEGTATVGMALWLVFLTTILADLGIGGTVARFAAECPHDNEERAARHLAGYALGILVRAIAGGLLLTAAILWLYWGDIVSKYASSPAEGLVFCALVLVCFVVHMLYAFTFHFLRGIRAFGTISLYATIGSVLQIGGAIAGSLLYGANGAFAAYILFSLPTLLGLARVKLSRPTEPLPDKPTMHRYALSFYIATLFSPLLWVRADTLIVDQAIGAEAVGLFTAATTIAALLLQVCQMITNALLPNIVRAARDSEGGFEAASRTAVRLALSLLLPACLIAAAAAPEAIGTVFGPAFAGGQATAAILCLAGLGSALTLVVASVLSAADGNRALARNGAAGAVVTVVAGSALALSFGLIGAALGRLVAQAFMGLLNVRSANRLVERLVTWNWIVRIMLAGLIGAGVTQLIGWWLGSGLLAILASLAGGGLVYLTAAAMLLPLGTREREQLLPILHRLPSSLRSPASWLLRAGGRS